MEDAIEREDHRDDGARAVTDESVGRDGVGEAVDIRGRDLAGGPSAALRDQLAVDDAEREALVELGRMIDPRELGQGARARLPWVDAPAALIDARRRANRQRVAVEEV